MLNVLHFRAAERPCCYVYSSSKAAEVFDKSPELQRRLWLFESFRLQANYIRFQKQAMALPRKLKLHKIQCRVFELHLDSIWRHACSTTQRTKIPMTRQHLVLDTSWNDSVFAKGLSGRGYMFYRLAIAHACTGIGRSPERIT